jgi:hypothetical protein
MSKINPEELSDHDFEEKVRDLVRGCATERQAHQRLNEFFVLDSREFNVKRLGVTQFEIAARRSNGHKVKLVCET